MGAGVVLLRIYFLSVFPGHRPSQAVLRSLAVRTSASAAERLSTCGSLRRKILHRPYGRSLIFGRTRKAAGRLRYRARDPPVARRSRDEAVSE